MRRLPMLSVSTSLPSVRVASLLGVLVAGFALASLFPSLLIALILSLLLAFMLRPFVRFFEIRLGIQRTLSVIIVLASFTLFLALNAAQGVPDLINHMRSLYAGFRSFPLDQKLDELVTNVVQGLPFVNSHTASAKIRLAVDASVRSLAQDAKAAAGSAFSFLIIPFVTYFALVEGDHAAKRVLERVPNKYFEMTLNVVDKIQKDLVGYLRGWLLDSFLVGIMNIIAFAVIGLPYPILLGTIAGISNLIPYVGPFVGIIPVILISVTQTGDLSFLPAIALLTLVVQLVDNVIVQPVCFANNVDMHPLTVIIVLIVGNELMGVLGMLLAIPLYTILKVTALESHWGLTHYRITA